MATPKHPSPEGEAGKAGSCGILVLGMHRSGTTLLVRIVESIGADVGQRLVPGGPGNDGGHWEDAFVVETNEALLHALDRDWRDPRPLPPGWMSTEAAVIAAERISSYGSGVLSHRPLWAIKDPRLCLLAPLWIKALGTTPMRLVALHPIRHPVEVAQSLAERDGLPHEIGALLWLRHVLAAEAASKWIPRRFVLFDDLIHRESDFASEVASLVGPERGRSAANRSPMARESLRHHTEGATNPSLPALVRAVWDELKTGLTDRDSGVDLDQYRVLLEAADNLFSPTLSDFLRQLRTNESTALMRHVAPRLDMMQRSLRGLEDAGAARAEDIRRSLRDLEGTKIVLAREADQRVKAAQHAVKTVDMALAATRLELNSTARRASAAEERVQALESSTSWRVTRPLRALGRFARRMGRSLRSK